MDTLFTKLNIVISDLILESAGQQAPNPTDMQIATIKFDIDYNLFGKDLAEFLRVVDSEIYLISIPTNWHMPWQKNKKTTIRIPIQSYNDSVEFLTESTKTDKDTMFNNKFRTYKVPYDYGMPYMLSSNHFHTVVNYSDTIRCCIDILVDMSYPDVVKYFKDRHLVSDNKYQHERIAIHRHC
jgi:hypothetical protein